MTPSARHTINYASTWDDLAAALGTTRRSLQQWRSDPRFAPDCPRDRADGRKEIAAWLEWMRRHNLKRGQAHIDVSEAVDENADEESKVVQPPLIGGSPTKWQTALVREKYERERLKRLTLEETLLVAAELEIPLGATLAMIQTKLSQFPARVARYLVGLRDAGEIEDKLRDEIDADLSDLQSAGYVETTLESILADLSFDDESARLVKLVTFSGQDEAALRELIARVAVECLRRIGSRAIDGAASSSGTEISSASADAAPDLAEKATAHSATANPETSEGEAAAPKPRKPRKRKTRKARAKPAPAPDEVEAAIVPAPKRKPKRRH